MPITRCNPNKNPSGSRASGSDRIVDNEEPLDANAAQAWAFEHIAQFMEVFRGGQFGGPARQDRPAVERLPKEKIELFKGTSAESSEMAENWLEDMVRVCDEIHCIDKEKLECLVSLLRIDATRWWEFVVLTKPEEERTYEFFRTEFRKNYVGQVYLDKRMMDFIHLKQRDKTVMDYKLEL